MKILGIDPGLGRVGWGMISSHESQVTINNSGCFETKKVDKEEQRLAQIYKFISELIENGKPDVVAVEEIFFAKNAKTAMSVGQARGVILLAAAQSGAEVVSYTPLAVKMAITGYGRAEKGQMKEMVKRILKMDTVPKLDDTADALAVAICHAFSYKMQDKQQATINNKN